MNIKKLLSFFVLTIFLFVNFGFTYANLDGYTTKQLILAKTELEKINKGDIYIRTIDSFVDRLAFNKEQKKLELIAIRLADIKNTLLEKTDTKSKQLFILVHYFDVKVNIALGEFYDQEEILEEILSKEQLSEEEIKQVEDKLVEIQLNLLDSGVNYLEKLINEFEDLSSYEESGDFNMSFDISHEELGEISSMLSFNDYSSKSSTFDAQLSGHLNALLEASLNDGENIKLSLDSMIDFISKDGNMYLLFQKLNITDEEGVEILQDKINTLKEIAEKNQYIKFEDKDAANAISILKSLTPSKIIADGKIALSEPMFEPYKKSGDKYYLKPTKYACDKLKELSNVFDPFNGSTCTDGQYKNMIEALEEVGSFYIILGNNTTLGFEGVKSDEIDKLEGYIIISNNYVKEFSFEVLPVQTKYPGEFLKINYKKSNSLTFQLYAENGDVDFDFNGVLNYDNTFSSINYTGNVKSNYEDFTSSFILKNREITGGFNLVSRKYNYDYYYNTTQDRYIDSLKFTGDISGTVDSYNKLKILKVDYSGTDLIKESQILSGNFNYNYGSFGGKLNVYDNGKSLFYLSYSGKYEDKYLNLNSNFELADIFGGYSKDARNSKRISDLNNIASSINIRTTTGVPLESFVVINDKYAGKDIYSGGNKLVLGENYFVGTPNYTALGIKKEDFLDPDGSEYLIGLTTENNGMFEIYSVMEGITGGEVKIIGNYSKVLENDAKGLIFVDGKVMIDGLIDENYTPSEESKITGTFDLELDTRNNKNNAIINLDVNLGDSDLLKFNMDNQAIRVYKDIEINAPIDYIDSEEVFPSSNYY